jgi:glyoxylase-like metal-dependent hydrolase (beta-lactamase superfamily II)
MEAQVAACKIGAGRFVELVERYGLEIVKGPVETGGLSIQALETPGHAPDHLAFVYDGACFTGDAVLGEGSVFVSDDLGPYLEALQRLRQLPLRVICPGHGPPVWDPKAKLDEYLAHRRERERKLLEALDQGLREEDELLDAVWDDAPAALRQAAAVTLGAHREKLRSEGRWPR